MYRHISRTWRKIWKNSESRAVYVSKKSIWRRGKTVQRVDKPSRINRARQFGFKAKKGYITVRVKVSRGGLRKIPPKIGRRQKRTGIKKIKRGKSMFRIAEQRAQRKYPNLKTLGSYYLGEDGQNKWFEVIFFDPVFSEKFA
jgi:large subunit ribosomal protein L15e